MLRPRQAGFSLLELMVTITLIGILIALGVPAFGKWTGDTRVRATAESLADTIRATRAGAMTRNRVTTFVLTNSTPAYNATAAASAENWFSGVIPMIGSTAETASSLGISQASTQATAYGIDIGASTTYNITVDAPGVICFNSMGQLTTQTAAQTSVSLACALPTTPTASPYFQYLVSSAKAARQYKVLVYPGGQVRMCDALKTLSNTNPDGCP